MILSKVIESLKREARIKRLIQIQMNCRKTFRILALYAHSVIYHKYNCDISINANIDKTVHFPHPVGIVIGSGVTIEKNSWIYQNVTIGKKNKDDDKKYPTIKENTVVYPNSVLVGDIICGPNAIIGAGSVVLCCVEQNSVYAGVPAKPIKSGK